MTRLIRKDLIHDGWSKLYRAVIRTDDGAELTREVEHHGDGVAILLFDAEARTGLMVRQLRNGPVVAGADDPWLLEVPAGLIDAGETPEQAVRREAMEEVGVRIGDLTFVATVWSSPGVSTERLTLFLAAIDADCRVAEGGGLDEEHEGIEVVETPLAELARMSAAGGITDAKTLILLLRLRLERPELFTG